MTWEITKHGWTRLPNGFDVQLEHGIPVRLSDNAKRLDRTLEEIEAFIAGESGLRVSIGPWEHGETDGEKEAALQVDPEQLSEVIRRLALASAALFVDRFNKAIDALDVDWDDAEYASDFETARRCCGLAWGNVDKAAHFDGYAATMHEETRRLAEAG